jgi:hypothetical protein
VKLVTTTPPNTGEYSTETHTVECDNIAAHTGFRPDPALWRELEVQVHAATDGVQRLAENVVRENRRAGVGLSTGYAEKRPASQQADLENKEKTCTMADDPELLRHMEPNFYVIGIKSYGRDAGFLMQNGFRQVRNVFRLLSGDASRDLYDDAL